MAAIASFTPVVAVRARAQQAPRATKVCSAINCRPTEQGDEAPARIHHFQLAAGRRRLGNKRPRCAFSFSRQSPRVAGSLSRAKTRACIGQLESWQVHPLVVFNGALPWPPWDALQREVSTPGFKRMIDERMTLLSTCTLVSAFVPLHRGQTQGVDLD